jgi:hypothetical protein
VNISFVQQRYGKRLEQRQLPPLFLILSQLAIFMKSLSMALQERTIQYMSYGMKHKIYGPGSGSGSLEVNIKCLVSLGTGIPSLKPFGDHFFEVSQTLLTIATETEKTAERFSRDKRQLYSDGRYYRFNVIRGLEDIRAEDSERKNAIVAATSRYLESQDVFNRLQSLSTLIKSSATLSSTEAYYDREGRAAYHAKEWTQAITLLKQALEGREPSRT